MQGRVDEAIPHLQEALRLDPSHAEAHSNLGVALARRGRVVEAIDHYREALRLDPEPDPGLLEPGQRAAATGERARGHRAIR